MMQIDANDVEDGAGWDIAFVDGGMGVMDLLSIDRHIV